MERLEQPRLELLYCDICHRSEVDAIIEGAEEPTPMSRIDGLMVCYHCQAQEDGPHAKDFPTVGNSIV